MKTFEKKQAEAWAQASQNALEVVGDWAMRFAKAGVVPPDSISAAVEKSMAELKMVLVDERERPAAKSVNAAFRSDRIRHLTFAACQIVAAIGLLQPIPTQEAPPADAKPRIRPRPTRAA